VPDGPLQVTGHLQQMTAHRIESVMPGYPFIFVKRLQ
jgi:hypothetical protein